jgi:hypothetical protein
VILKLAKGSTPPSTGCLVDNLAGRNGQARCLVLAAGPAVAGDTGTCRRYLDGARRVHDGSDAPRPEAELAVRILERRQTLICGAREELCHPGGWLASVPPGCSAGSPGVPDLTALVALSRCRAAAVQLPERGGGDIHRCCGSDQPDAFFRASS